MLQKSAILSSLFPISNTLSVPLPKGGLRVEGREVSSLTVDLDEEFIPRQRLSTAQQLPRRFLHDPEPVKPLHHRVAAATTQRDTERDPTQTVSSMRWRGGVLTRRRIRRGLGQGPSRGQ